MPAGIYRIRIIFMSGISVILEILISLFDFILLGWRYRSVTGGLSGLTSVRLSTSQLLLCYLFTKFGLLKLLSVMTGDNRYETILRNEEGVYTMCDVAERLEKKGESRLADLIKILLAENRIDELGKVASDEEERKRLYKEYGIID